MAAKLIKCQLIAQQKIIIYITTEQLLRKHKKPIIAENIRNSFVANKQVAIRHKTIQPLPITNKKQRISLNQNPIPAIRHLESQPITTQTNQLKESSLQIVQKVRIGI